MFLNSWFTPPRWSATGRRVHVRHRWQGAVLKHSTENPEAYELCLKARHAWCQWTRDGLRTAINLFQQTLAEDPNYALAHFGMGDRRVASAMLALDPRDDAFTTLEQTLEVDDLWVPMFLTFCPTLDDLRPDPRFAERRRRIGL